MPAIHPDAEAIARRVVELLRGNLPPDAATILTRSEAKAYVRRESEGAFVAWCRRWKIKPTARGRYSRAQLDLALGRETGLAHTPSTLRRHQAQIYRGAA